MILFVLPLRYICENPLCNFHFIPEGCDNEYEELHSNTLWDVRLNGVDIVSKDCPQLKALGGKVVQETENLVLIDSRNLDEETETV